MKLKIHISKFLELAKAIQGTKQQKQVNALARKFSNHQPNYSPEESKNAEQNKHKVNKRKEMIHISRNQ